MMNFSENSRVWIYQSDRRFTSPEIDRISQQLSAFAESWQAHGHDLEAGFEIRYDRFIILFVDEEKAGATGCSIDKSVGLMKAIEQEFHVNLFDRFNIAYKKNGEVLSCSRSEFEALIANGGIDENTIVFNNTIGIKRELDANWEVPFSESWHPRVFTIPRSSAASYSLK